MCVCLYLCVCVYVWFYWVIIQDKRQNIFPSVHHGQKHLKNLALPQPVPFFCSYPTEKCYCQKLPPPRKHSCLSSPSLSTGDEHWLVLELVCLCRWTNRSRCAFYVSLLITDKLRSPFTKMDLRLWKDLAEGISEIATTNSTLPHFPE